MLDATTQMDCYLDLALLNRFNVNEIFNKSHHGLTTNQLVDLLVFMQKQGDLAIYRNRKGIFPEFDAKNILERAPQVRVVVDFTPIWDNPVFYPKAAIIEDFYMAEEQRKKYQDYVVMPEEVWHQETLCFCATRQGAEKWEKTAQVDWNKYLDSFAIYPDDADLSEGQWLTYCHAAALSVQTLDAWFDWKIRWDAHPDSHETSCFKRYRTEKISPWKATYWKTFPEGCECDFWEYTIYPISQSEGMNEEEHDRFVIYSKQSTEEYLALFDWCNSYVKDFPFEDD